MNVYICLSKLANAFAMSVSLDDWLEKADFNKQLNIALYDLGLSLIESVWTGCNVQIYCKCINQELYMWARLKYGI